MKRFTLTGSFLVGWGFASLAFGGSPTHIDRPTPPPCAADGTCYPSENTWGWYPCHWRQWPGEVLVPTPAGAQPTPAEGAGGPLKPYETPPLEQEDVQAPPSTKKSETAAPESAPPTPPAEGAAPTRTPAGPGTQAEPGGRQPQAAPTTPYPSPNYPTPNYPTPTRPAPGASSGARPSTTDNDPPPSLPWQLSSSPRRSAMADTTPRASLQQRPAAPRQPAGNDPPPSLPSVFHSAAL